MVQEVECTDPWLFLCLLTSSDYVDPLCGYVAFQLDENVRNHFKTFELLQPPKVPTEILSDFFMEKGRGDYGPAIELLKDRSTSISVCIYFTRMWPLDYGGLESILEGVSDERFEELEDGLSDGNGMRVLHEELKLSGLEVASENAGSVDMVRVEIYPTWFSLRVCGKYTEYFETGSFGMADITGEEDVETADEPAEAV